MKKNIIITVMGILIIAIIGAVIYNKANDITSDKYLYSRNEESTFISHTNQNYTDNSMSFNFKEFDGKWSFFDLSLENGADISIDDNSEIDGGQLYLLVLDKDYNIIDKKEVNGKGKLEFSSEDGGEYLIRIV